MQIFRESNSAKQLFIFPNFNNYKKKGIATFHLRNFHFHPKELFRAPKALLIFYL